MEHVASTAEVGIALLLVHIVRIVWCRVVVNLELGCQHTKLRRKGCAEYELYGAAISISNIT